VTIEPREVTHHLNLGPRERSARQVDDVVTLARVDLQTNRAAWSEDSRRIGKERPDEIESILAAVESQSRLGGNRGILLDLVRTQVREIGDHEIDRTSKPGSERALDKYD